MTAFRINSILPLVKSSLHIAAYRRIIASNITIYRDEYLEMSEFLRNFKCLMSFFSVAITIIYPNTYNGAFTQSGTRVIFAIYNGYRCHSCNKLVTRVLYWAKIACFIDSPGRQFILYPLRLLFYAYTRHAIL